MKAYILLGGEGSRLRPLTTLIPKPLLPIAGKPVLWHQLELLRRHGVKEVVLGLGYHSELFRKRLLEKNLAHSFPEMSITFVEEKEPLGTGGALALAAPSLQEGSFILNGDILTELNLSGLLAFHQKKVALVTIAVIRLPYPRRYGLVSFDGNNRVTAFEEKPAVPPTKGWINAGIYLFEPEVLVALPVKKFSLERELFPRLVREGKPVFAYPFSGYWRDIGTLDAYLQAKLEALTLFQPQCRR